MKREKFLQCRNEIMDVLKKYGAEGSTQTRILASALNEHLNPSGFQVKLLVSGLPASDEGNVDILRRLKSGDSQRRQSYDCNPERVPASTRLPRGTRLGFRRKHSHVGNFTGTNQPPIPPGLTISPQADTACPAAVSPVSKQRQESQNSSQGTPYIPALKSGALRRVEVTVQLHDKVELTGRTWLPD